MGQTSCCSTAVDHGLQYARPCSLLLDADMLNKGYEWSYKYGEPRNAPPKRYLVQPKCCRVTWCGLPC